MIVVPSVQVHSSYNIVRAPHPPTICIQAPHPPNICFRAPFPATVCIRASHPTIGVWAPHPPIVCMQGCVSHSSLRKHMHVSRSFLRDFHMCKPVQGCTLTSKRSSRKPSRSNNRSRGNGVMKTCNPLAHLIQCPFPPQPSPHGVPFTSRVA